MTSDQFIYWLQGALELGNIKTMDETQVQVLKDHLALVMTKVTPDYTSDPNTFRIHPEPYVPPTPYSPTFPFYKPMSTGDEIPTPPVVTCSTTDFTKMCSPLVCDSTASTLECSPEKSQLRDFTPEEKDRARELIAKMGEFNKKARSNGSNW